MPQVTWLGSSTARTEPERSFGLHTLNSAVRPSCSRGSPLGSVSEAPGLTWARPAVLPRGPHAHLPSSLLPTVFQLVGLSLRPSGSLLGQERVLLSVVGAQCLRLKRIQSVVMFFSGQHAPSSVSFRPHVGARHQTDF